MLTALSFQRQDYCDQDGFKIARKTKLTVYSTTSSTFIGKSDEYQRAMTVLGELEGV
jgi:hypothetical protein